MNKYTKKYQEIVNELVEKSFSELRKSIPKAFELKFTKLHGVYLPIVNRVGINKLCREFPRDEIRGILAHELCHAEISGRYGFLKNFFDFIVYWFSSSVRKNEEDKADYLVIRKGYAKLLVLSSARLEKLYLDYKNKTFMSVDRIKSYAKKIKKW